MIKEKKMFSIVSTALIIVIKNINIYRQDILSEKFSAMPATIRSNGKENF